MQRKKIIVASITLLLAALTVPSISIPRAHAFLNTNQVNISGLGVSGFTLPGTSTTVTGIAAGATLTINVYIVASSVVYQRNVTVGFKGDWMSSYTNASAASSTSTLPLTAGQTASISFTVTVPSTGGLAAHSWNVVVWDSAANSANGSDITACNNSEKANPTPCWSVSNNQAGYRPLAIFTSDQLAGAQANVQAKTVIPLVTTEINNLALQINSHGVSAAAGQLAQANTELANGDQSWLNGDYSGAKTHYQNAANDANAAAETLINQGGGTDNANEVNLLLGSTGVALIGVGALLAGIGALFYLRRKSK